MWKYVWGLFVFAFLNHYIGSTVSRHDSKPFINVFLHYSVFKNDGSYLKHGFHSSIISEKVFTFIFCLILWALSSSAIFSSTSLPHSEVLVALSWRFQQTELKTNLASRAKTQSAHLKMKLHARINETLIFREMGPSHRDTTHTNTCTSSYCSPSACRETSKWALYLTPSGR